VTDRLKRREALYGDRVARLERMLEIRALEDRVQQLFSEGEIHGTTHLCQGQEAVAVGLAAATLPEDWVTCTYRGHGVALALGETLEAVLGEIMGRSCGSVGGLGGSMHLCSPEVGLLPTFAIVGAGMPVAVGAALSCQMLRDNQIAVSVFGDGAANIGAFHESLNLASIWKLPVVFVCENNLYGEYTRIDRTTPVEDIAIRAHSYAIPSEIVDGQDLDAVVDAIRRASDHARSGHGPFFVEAKTYRYGGHSRADKATYRPEGELDLWLKRDPIQIFEDNLIQERELSRDHAAALMSDVSVRLDEAVNFVRHSPEPEPREMFRHVYA
jgi:TPP-dependent pyruvate/acetoin dehydrogenase alpha subunit